MKISAMAATSAPKAPRKQGLFRRIFFWILDIDEVTPEEARERMRKGRGFLDSLTPEQLEYLRKHEGPDYLGPPLTRRNRRFLLEQRPPAPQR